MFQMLARNAGSLLVAFALSTLQPSDRDLHQGAWQATSFLFDGTETPKAIVETIVREVEGDHVVWKRSGKSFAGTKVTLDPKADPKTIDVQPDGGPNRGQVVLGLYKLEGDKLTLCMAPANGERPKTFDAKKGSKQTLMTFQRIAQTPPNPAK